MASKSLLFLATLGLLLTQTHGKGGHWYNQDFREESEDYNTQGPDGYPMTPYDANNQSALNPPPIYGVVQPQPYESGTIRASQSYTPLIMGQDPRRRSRSKSKTSQLIPVGDICDPTDPLYNKCVESAHCVHFESENVYKCNCSYSYEISSTKKCMRSHGHYCDSKDPCTDFLKCIDNRCECDNSAVYQNPFAKCQSRIGGPCSATQGPDCVANAVCLSFDRYGRNSRCVCKDGFVETLDGLCTAGVGMPCEGLGICNTQLVCKEGVCSCRESVHVYDPETNSCVGMVGAQCCSNFDGVDCPNGITNGCVSGAFCKKTSKNLPGRCVCQSYNLESDMRTCSPNPTFGQMVPGKTY